MNCDGCTFCCLVLPVKGRDKKAYAECRDCDTGVGCTRYDERPPECVAFDCAYRQAPSCGDELRPDKCGVVFERMSDQIMFGSVATELTDAARLQVSGFQEQGFSVVLDHRGKRRLIVAPAPGRTADAVATEFRIRRDLRAGV